MFERFALFAQFDRLAKLVDAAVPDVEASQRYNVALGTWIQAIRQVSDDEAATFEEMWWVYRPKWAKDSGSQPINAQVETVVTNAYFKSAFAKHLGLIPAGGWYEWIKNSSPKQPHYICRKDREPFSSPVSLLSVR
ncbi:MULTISPECIES: SOS response-associated peptidase family protein [unclassified Halomonas]|uniref:SOS response-associated peptidase family protein n=1 Tax=unclassified Halomonas TaxID=2609666 RepID=UPI0009EDACF3|nr:MULTISPECIES: SOS response-associated peptidase family protein [unclassified Halomonas]MBT2788037.1 SOS response-associated peptidase family protein [Halomonas sp. ISL-106]MBT2795786.1 SOS response-associated peptidase family protein [Halomonas sp. ISL-104]